jgi:hypothetical protein
MCAKEMADGIVVHHARIAQGWLMSIVRQMSIVERKDHDMVLCVLVAITVLGEGSECSLLPRGRRDTGRL